MAISLITNGSARNTNAGGVGPATTSAFDSTGGNFIIVFGAWYGGVADVTCVDNKGNTYTPLTARSAANFPKVRLFYAENPTVGTGHTITVESSGNGAFASMAFAVFSGLKLASSFDVENGATTGGSTTLSTGSITPSEDNELIVAGVGWQTAGRTASIDNGMTITNQLDAVGNESIGHALAYKIQTTAAAINPQWTLDVSDSMAAAIASFKAEAAAGQTEPRFLSPTQSNLSWR